MRKCVFLDRDGVIIEERGAYSHLPEHATIIADIGKNLKILQEAGFLLIVITNQGGIGLGLYGHEEVEEIHRIIISHLEDLRVQLDEWYYCPHHPKTGHCLCRKPDSLMLEKAIARFEIDVSQSWFIGDNARDVEAGQKVGVNTLLVPANTSLETYLPKILESAATPGPYSSGNA